MSENSENWKIFKSKNPKDFKFSTRYGREKKQILTYEKDSTINKKIIVINQN